MFGLLLTAAGFLVTLGSGVKETIANNRSKDWAIDDYRKGLNPAKVYYDTRGKCRDLRTGHPIMTSRDSNTGDYLGQDLKTWVTTNYTQEYRDALFQYYLDNPEEGRTVVIDREIGSGNRPRFYNHEPEQYCCWGQWYKDLTDFQDVQIDKKTKIRIYTYLVGRCDRYADWYMNVYSCKYVRPTDEWLEEHKGDIDEAKLEAEKEAHNKWVDEEGWKKEEYWFDETRPDIFFKKYKCRNQVCRTPERHRKDIENMGPMLKPIHYAR